MGSATAPPADHPVEPKVRPLPHLGAGTEILETYTHDANNNVVQQNVDNVITSFNCDRNRLLTATIGGAPATYNHDPFGRLDKVTSGSDLIERYTYDGFDRIIEHRKSAQGTTGQPSACKVPVASSSRS